jgi:hypothetical protein
MKPEEQIANEFLKKYFNKEPPMNLSEIALRPTFPLTERPLR